MDVLLIFFYQKWLFRSAFRKHKNRLTINVRLTPLLIIAAHTSDTIASCAPSSKMKTII